MPNNLRKQVIDDLPESIQKFMKHIQDFANLDIEILINTNPPSPTDPNPHGPACHVSHNFAKILIRDPDKIDPNGIAHELLHIERYWIERVPQIIPHKGGGDKWKITSDIENTLEHLIIVPKEVAFGFNPNAHWNQTAQRNWNRYPWPDNTNEFARRKNCLLGWLSADLVTDNDLKRFIKACLETEGIYEEAERFRTRVKSAINNKTRMLTITVGALRIPRAETRLLRFNVKNQSRKITKMPSIY